MSTAIKVQNLFKGAFDYDKETRFPCHYPGMDYWCESSDYIDWFMVGADFASEHLNLSNVGIDTFDELFLYCADSWYQGYNSCQSFGSFCAYMAGCESVCVIPF